MRCASYILAQVLTPLPIHCLQEETLLKFEAKCLLHAGLYHVSPQPTVSAEGTPFNIQRKNIQEFEAQHSLTHLLNSQANLSSSFSSAPRHQQGAPANAARCSHNLPELAAAAPVGAVIATFCYDRGSSCGSFYTGNSNRLGTPQKNDGYSCCTTLLRYVYICTYIHACMVSHAAPPAVWLRGLRPAVPAISWQLHPAEDVRLLRLQKNLPQGQGGPNKLGNK